MNWSPYAINAIREIGHGMSVRERVKLAAALLRTLSSDERAQVVAAAGEPEHDAHARKAFARLNRTSVDASSATGDKL